MKKRSIFSIALSIFIFTNNNVYAQNTPIKKQEGKVNIQKLQTEDDKINILFADYKTFLMNSYPEWADYEGIHKNSDKLTDYSEQGINDRYRKVNLFLKLLNKNINFKNLSKANQINYQLFEKSLVEELDGQKFNWEYTPLTQQGGIHIEFPQISDYQPIKSLEDYDKYFIRLENFPVQISQVIENMENGIEKKITIPKFIVLQIIEQIENIKKIDIDKSPFLFPINKNKDLNKRDKLRLEMELKQILYNSVFPAYDILHNFLKSKYLKKARKESGIWSLPDGEERYNEAIRSHTSINLSAEQIHNIGLSEVKRIKKLMEKVKNEIGFSDSLDEFNKHLRTDVKFTFENKEDLIDFNQKILDKMQKKLPELFGILPKAPVEIKEMELYRAKSAPQAYYYSAPEDRSRPAYYYINTFNLPQRPKYTMTALALHEAVPGHHLQIAISQELKELPWFRKKLGVTAFVEGWGLYSESLGYETNMYNDLYQKYGALTFEIWRACRLVVDTGIHYKKWNREKAVQYMIKNTPNSEHDIRSEVDRYIVWPGQALAYKIGELKIKELRKLSEDKLGNKFDIKEFHDNILKNGAIPLDLLEKNIKEWIEKKATNDLSK